MSAQLPNCPTCDTPVHRSELVGGYVSYACDNEACEHFPATGYAEEIQARKEWLEIVEANKPLETEPQTKCPVCGGKITHGINGYCSFVCAMSRQKSNRSNPSKP